MKKFETGCYIDNGDGTYSPKGLFVRFFGLLREAKIDLNAIDEDRVTPWAFEQDTINNKSPEYCDEIFNKFIGALNDDPRTEDEHYWGWSEVESGVFGYWRYSPCG